MKLDPRDDTESALMREYLAAVWPELANARLFAAAKLVAENFETYGSAIKVTVPMALIENLQKALAQFPSEPRLCEDCPPVGYPTDKTRCLECPRRVYSEN